MTVAGQGGQNGVLTVPCSARHGCAGPKPTIRQKTVDSAGKGLTPNGEDFAIEPVDLIGMNDEELYAAYFESGLVHEDEQVIRREIVRREPQPIKEASHL